MKNMKTVFPADEQGFFLEPIGSTMGAYNNDDGDGDDHGGGAADDDDDDDDDDVNDEFAVTVGAEAHEIHSSWRIRNLVGELMKCAAGFGGEPIEELDQAFEP